MPFPRAVAVGTYAPDIHRARTLHRKDRRGSGLGCNLPLFEHWSLSGTFGGAFNGCACPPMRGGTDTHHWAFLCDLRGHL